jgi:PAS domain S-box-containing protein
MDQSDEEEKLLRSVALQNAQSILLARQRAEESLEQKTQELAHSLALVRATLESTSDGILVTNSSGKVTNFNQKFVVMWQIPQEIMNWRNHREIIKSTSLNFKDPGTFLHRIEEIYATSPTESYDLLELANGKVFERFSRIQYVDDQNVGRVWSFRDITDHRRFQEALKKQSDWLRVTLASIGDAVITTDHEGRINFLNRVAESLTGWKIAEAIGRSLTTVFRIINERTREPVENPAIRALQEGVVVGLANHTVLIAKDGIERPIDDSAAPIQDDQGQIAGVVLIFRDITERRKAEETLREADRRKDEFLAMLAHELRNPLAPVRNALQIIRLQGRDLQTMQSVSEMMDRQVGQMVRLVDDLLDVSRISRGKIELRKERSELASIVHHVVEATRSLFRHMNHELTIELPSDPIFLNADPTRLAQILGNLLNNAYKFTPKGGSISLLVQREANEAVIRIRDSGIGIAANQLSRIFDIFVQVDTSLERSVSGLGIGLTLVKRLVEMHNGSVKADSAGIGRGSEFVVRLPILEEITKSLTEPPIISEPIPRTAHRILVVDDNRDSATSMATLLEMSGNETRTAFDGLEALEIAETFRPDLVLLDIGLPKLNGYEVARKIREWSWGKKMLLVALTGWGQEDDRRKSREAGFNDHLVKPVDYLTLLRLLATIPSMTGFTN